MNARGYGSENDPLPGAVERLRRREEDAAAAVDRLLRPRLLRYFRAGPWPKDEAEDLVQQTLVLVFKNVDGLRDHDRFLPWLFAIARNVRSTSTARWAARQRFESVGLEGSAEPQAANDLATREQDQLHAERAAALRLALARLPPRQRQCLLLRCREQLSYGEIAATLQLSEHTVRNHIAQAKESLRRLLEQAHEARMP